MDSDVKVDARLLNAENTQHEKIKKDERTSDVQNFDK